MVSAARVAAERTFRSLRNRNYRLYWCGQVVSLIRTRHEIQRVAWADSGVGGTAIIDNQTVVWFDPQRRRGAVVLTSGRNGQRLYLDVLDLLDPESPVAAYLRQLY